MLIPFVLGIITVIVCLTQALAFNRLCRYVRREMSRESGNYLPLISVILPCKGLDPGFAENMEKLLAQDYLDPAGQPRFEIVFAVATVDDPAYGVLEQLCRQSSKVPAKVVVAG